MLIVTENVVQDLKTNSLDEILFPREFHHSSLDPQVKQ